MSQANKKNLVFVYNANSGLFNTLVDIGHKIFSPETYECELCNLTHSYFTMRKKWKDFIDNLSIEATFLHKDEFKDAYKSNTNYRLPAVFLLENNTLTELVSRDKIGKCRNLDDLIDLLTINLQNLKES